MSELENEIKGKFAHLSDDALINRMSRAPDFGYDDEEVELTRRLKLGGFAWRWATIDGKERVDTYPLDLTTWTEEELFAISTKPPLAPSPIGRLVVAEYWRRQHELDESAVQSSEFEVDPTKPADPEAVRIINDLMDMLKDHPDYHGSGPIDYGYQYLMKAERQAEAQS